MFEPCQVRRESHVCQTVMVRRQPLMLRQRLLHFIEQQHHALNGDHKVLRAWALLNHIAPALSLEDVGNLLEHFLSEFAALEILMTKRKAETDDGGGSVMDVLIELLGPQTNSSATIRVRRRERRIRISLFEIFENDIRFRDDLVSINERWHDSTRIELDVPGLLMLTGAEHEVTVLPFESFFRETHAHLLGAKRHVIVVESQHCRIPLSFACPV